MSEAGTILSGALVSVGEYGHFFLKVKIHPHKPKVIEGINRTSGFYLRAKNN